jgi:hypothetical protein
MMDDDGWTYQSNSRSVCSSVHDDNEDKKNNSKKNTFKN